MRTVKNVAIAKDDPGDWNTHPDPKVIVDNVNNNIRPTGTSKDAALRRLRKDRADLHEKVIAGEISAHAAIEAGEVTSTAKGTYQVGKSVVAGAEVDRWRKLAAIPQAERESLDDAQNEPQQPKGTTSDE